MVGSWLNNSVVLAGLSKEKGKAFDLYNTAIHKTKFDSGWVPNFIVWCFNKFDDNGIMTMDFASNVKIL